MKKTISVFLIAALLLCFVSCSKGEKEAETEVVAYTPVTVEEQYYYAMGYFASQSYAANFSDIDFKAFAEGFTAQGNGTVTLSDEEVNDIVYNYFAKEADAFLEENKKTEGVKVTESGLQYKVIKEGTGKTPTADSVVVVDYELSLADGTIVDSTYKNGEKVTIALASTIEGFREGVLLMQEGAKYQMWINPRLGYGENNLGSIPPFSALVYTVELVSVEN